MDEGLITPFMRDLFSNIPAIARAVRRAARNLIPPAHMLPSQWAEANLKIPAGNSVPGMIRFDNAPYQRGMIDAIVEPGIRRVSYMTGAQLGKTTVQQGITGYFIEHDPRSQIFIQPTQGDVQTFQETKLRPMLDANPKIAKRMAKARGRDGANNSRIISYIGGWLMFGWAGSPRTLRGRSAPVTQADEVDGMTADTGEGDPLELLAQRAATFGDLQLRTESSTPTIKGESRIETSFLAGDQRRFYVPCPDCGEQQYLKWSQVLWNGRDNLEGDQDPDSARYVCEHCGSLWDDGQRVAAIRTAESKGGGWKAAKPFKGHASFHAPEMLSTFRKLREIVQSYLDKLAAGDLQSFVNVSLAETFEETAEKADPESLYNRREVYAATVPMHGLYLTAGVDMQPDRLEVEIVAWGLFERSWSVAYRVLWGDPLAGDVWDDLDDLLAEEWQHESGAMLKVQATCVDTGGNKGYTQSAYEYVRARSGRRIFAIKGVPGWGRAIVEKPQRKQSGKRSRKVDLFLVGVDEAKRVVMRRLALLKDEPGYCRFPVDDDHGEDYFKQLTAEKLVTKFVRGFPVREWHKPEKARNEALDCRVYALAALKIMNPSMKALAKRLILDTKTSIQSEETPESTEKWAETVANRDIRLKETLEKVRDAASAGKRNPHVEPDARNGKTPVIKRAKSLTAGRRRGGFATNW
ncbi:phage terminase large subunit family protein [Burkholderia ubonensis]|uniref:phage terminase large subunit family protein n=1 Tax=Burkholderia ubonensis TaxID=101571 RepID=UPI0009B5957A|nr:phage terminase large subunit family protein [Burkholderia ubonensis]